MRLRRLFFLPAFALAASFASAADLPEIRIGVLAYKGADAVRQDWSYVTRHLQASIPGVRFVLADYDQAGLTRAVHGLAIDFAITSSGHYVALEHSDGASRIATLESPWTDSPRFGIGSAIVVRQSAPLHDLADLKGKNVMAVASDAFGGYQIAARELKEAGIDPARDFASLRYSGFPSQQIIAAIRSGTADAGIVRTCLLEQMMAQGQVAANELRVITTRPIAGFRCATSSRLYPDWPFVTLRQTSPALAKQVALALLAMPRTEQGYSWTVPSDYQSVDELFHELRIGPYAYLNKLTFDAALERYWGWMLLLLALLVAWAVHTVRVEYLVSRRTQQLRTLQEQARQHQARQDHTARLAILGEMASAIAHELNQPLAAIGNFARGMVRRIDAGRLEPAPLFEGAQEIATQSERAGAIIRHIRAMAQKRPAQSTKFALSDTVEQAVALFRAAHPHAQIVAEMNAGQAQVLADPQQVQQVLLNLLKNALDAQTENGNPNHRVSVLLQRDDGACSVTVRDAGCGLDEAHFARLFEPFFTTKAEGLGLGMSLSKSIIESFGGTLSARANDDTPGLTVCFRLPEATHVETPHDQ
ncbi:MULTISPECIES: sensor histidine kinase [unclassified Janthinobacterium]|uniref:sensor histidine kinase n=1 Tax=unclassified Janthinobacterium TaxID=2610881 RepID=UPI001622E657|nr:MULTISPECIES: sensor histidine kinase [unclassified Janthinobacterium]MBB5370806.1 two-component system sensor histidine kinase TtrS [Janthinobacterium sp. K2C7]MBB5383612.1 two-component system sensor histidine kinase TtrS [Janthinobacterium sp. K2Li3]MBB5389066.1 two-component system sensor histidine kinase TtrS [Janthinobacterium sp. K2E3]